MNIVIRTDASTEIGTGHIMRCLTLAEQLRGKGAKVSFICRAFEGNLNTFIEEKGFSVYILTDEAGKDHWTWVSENWGKDALESKSYILSEFGKIDLLVADHYSLDFQWERNLRSCARKIMVIDDLADREHDCDLLLDQNYYLNMESRYENLIPEHCVQLLGPDYVLLREEFLAIDPDMIKRDGSVRNIFVFFGGSDPTGETLKTLHAIQLLNRPDIHFDVVIGNTNPQKQDIKALSRKLENVTLHCQIDYMAKLMAEADFAVGAGGTTAWERFYFNLPSLIIIVADNQEELSKDIQQVEAAICVGRSEKIKSEHICKGLYCLTHRPDLLVKMQHQCKVIMDVKHVQKRPVVQKIMECFGE